MNLCGHKVADDRNVVGVDHGDDIVRACDDVNGGDAGEPRQGSGNLAGFAHGCLHQQVCFSCHISPSQFILCVKFGTLEFYGPPIFVSIAPQFRESGTVDCRMKLLEQGARSLGIHLSASQLDRFERYYRELAEWNQRANLTAITGYEETQVRHFLDSLTACLAFRRDDGTGPGSLPGVDRMVDVGSGAGFPGLPLKLAFPDIELHLIESVGKKAAFLEHVSGLLELEGVSVHSGRAEALARQPDLRESFDLALVRGVARLSLLLEYTLPFCRVGGRTVAHKHGGLEEELAGAEHALSELGGRVAGVYPVTLDGLTDNRVVVAFEKTAPTPDRYPRRVGIPAKRPL